MLRQLLTGSAISLLNIAGHAVITVLLIASLRRVEARLVPSRAAFQLIVVMATAVSILMLAHYIEIGIWAGFYSWAGVTSPGRDSFDFAFVNFTTLGYGDTLPTAEWRLIGPITAMNGMLLFGWSVAVIFAVLRGAMMSLGMIDKEHGS